MTGKEVVSAGPQLPATPESKAFRFDLAGIPIPLKRTFGALDRLIALPIEALGDYVEKKLKGNVDSHVEAVQKKRRKRGKRESVDDPSIKTTKQIGSWAEGAAEIDPGERDLAAVWRAVLDEILDANDDAEDLLQVVKSARPSDIRFFLGCYAEKYPRKSLIKTLWEGMSFSHLANDEAITVRLNSLGLIRKSISNGFMATYLTLSGVPTLLGIFAGIAAGKIQPTRPDHLFVIGLFIIVLTGVLVGVFSSKKPTDLGKRLCALYDEYIEERD